MQIRIMYFLNGKQCRAWSDCSLRSSLIWVYTVFSELSIQILRMITVKQNESPHDKTNNVAMHPAKTQISLGIPPVWSESSLSSWRNLGSLATHWANSEDSDQTGRMSRLIWVFAGRTCHIVGFVIWQRRGTTCHFPKWGIYNAR